MKQSKIIIMAIVISATAHALFFVISPHIRVGGMQDLARRTRVLFRLNDVEEHVIDVDLSGSTSQEVPSIKMSNPDLAEDGLMFKDLSIPDEALKDMATDVKKKELVRESLRQVDIKERDIYQPGDIMKAHADKAREEASPEKRHVEKNIIREVDVVKRLTVPSRDVSRNYVVEDTGAIGVEDYEPEMPAREDAFRPDEKSYSSAPRDIRVGEYEDIGSLMDLNVLVYEEEPTGAKYFKIVVNADPSEELKVIPKEMTFMVDSSKSMTARKLEYIKEGILRSLKELNPGDRFNIVAFKGNLIKFKESSIFFTDKSYHQARSFLRQLEATGQTDVENALLGIVREYLPMTPSYVLLATDGRPTTGLTDSKRIIREITRTNDMKRPVFCFGGGKRVNRYLLDFISFQNRAWSHFAPQEYDMGSDYLSFYSEIKDPLLLNVRYLFNGVDTKEVYPKFLPDLYRGRSFVLYGRVDAGKSFTLQLLGDIKGFTKEMLFTADLKSAAKGGPEIAKEWAFMKIYYLISLDTMGASDPESLRQQIDTLSRKYGITTPYDITDIE